MDHAAATRMALPTDRHDPAPAPACESFAAASAAFPEHERRLLLSCNGLGPRVVLQLERAGLGSLRLLQDLGAERALELTARSHGQTWLRNRRRALERALRATQPSPQPGAHAAPVALPGARR